MSESDQAGDRIYVRPSKPLSEMSAGERDGFAEQLFKRIMARSGGDDGLDDAQDGAEAERASNQEQS
jgi:hypothetical protein